jgi:Flp pilus assembly protein TadB
VPTFLSRVVSVLLRLVLVGVGLVFGLMALLAGLVLAFWLIVWSVLRGRKPTVQRFRMNPSQPFGGMGAGMRRKAPAGDVVDIEAREVPEVPQQIHRDRG